ncbi:unnamed protein product [Adineta ricciae]|uniref:Alpha-(1,6)-fucosyltransferase N- and catalytic domain-containing protein n=1 Tax=Adineta ricciae TaxID=249248 RepID=A0A814LMV2_ADIRI|nr:unnamed protein product [Adineta ricciae]
MVGWFKILKLTPLLFLPIAFYLFHHQSYFYSIVSIAQKCPCSFDSIASCQACRNPKRTLMYIIWGKGGYCSEMNQLLLAFAYSVWSKRHFIIDARQWNYGNFSHYFHVPSMNYFPYTNRMYLGKNNSENELIDHAQTTRTGNILNRFWIASLKVQSLEKIRYVTHYLWKSLTNETFKFIEEHRIKRLPKTYIGIHVRKGDKLIKEAREIPLMEYITLIEAMVKRKKTIRHIFVASDDHTVIGQLRRLRPRWYFVGIDRRKHRKTNTTGHYQKNFDQLSEKDKIFETRLFMTEMQMLIDAKYVLCGMSSNVCRFIQLLRHQNPATLISLDYKWRST